MAGDLIDPRVPRADYEAAETYGQRMSVLLEGIYDAAPGDDVAPVWDRLPEAHRALYVIDWAMMEIYNGALHQYFANSTGERAAELPAAARFFGADALAAVFEGAIAFFDVSRLPDRDYRNDRLDEIEAEGRLAEFDALTDEIHRLEDDGDDIWEHLAQYVETHPETFFADP